MMMLIVFSIIAYVAVAAATFVACYDDGVFSALSTALFWPLVVVVAAVTAIITSVAMIVAHLMNLIICLFGGKKELN